MNALQKKRYIFIDFDNLQSVKFKKLEKVCDRVFIFIDVQTKSIPFSLARQIQKLGKAVKWITVDQPIKNDMNYHICFWMGKLHQKVSREIEFAILSNDRSFDPLVNFINADERSCLRVKSRKAEKEQKNPILAPTPQKANLNGGKKSEDLSRPLLMDTPVDENQLVEETANETIARLIRSGNRPVDVSMLRNYILLHNQELTEHSNVDRIIEHLHKNNNIALEEGDVIYNF